MNISKSCDDTCYVRPGRSCNTEHARVNLEARCIRYALRALKAKGWTITGVNDGQDLIRTSLESAAIEAIFSVDNSSVYFQHKSGKRGRFDVVLGNGIDVIPDCSPNIWPIISTAYDHFETLA